MDTRKEQRLCIKFCANLGISGTEILTKIQRAFGDQCLCRAYMFQWHARIKTGLTSVDNDECAGRRRTCTTPQNVARIQELFHQDRRRTIHDIPEEVGIVYGTSQRVLTEDLRMHHVAAFNMTTTRLTLPSSPNSFWRKTKWLSTPSLRTPLIWHPVTSSYFKNEIEVERTSV